MMRRWLAASLIALLALPVLLAAQPDEGDRTQPLRSWLDAVDRHQPGATDSALILMGIAATAGLQRIWADVRVLFGILKIPISETFFIGAATRVTRIKYTEDELAAFREIAKRFEPPDALNRFLRRAAILHGDVALLSTVVPETGLPMNAAAPQRYVMEVGDGENLGHLLLAPHWELARSLLDQLKPSPTRDDTARLWYGATLTSLLAREHYNMPHLARALALFPDDPMILLQAGAIREGLAAPSMQRALRSIKLPRGLTSQVASAQSELERAQQMFERALRADPNFAEARLRLGHVLSRQGKYRLAVTELERARNTPNDPLVRYYAGLFLGAAEVQLGNVPRARVAYASALALYPRAQSPRLALSQLAKAAGADDMARQEVEQVVRLPVDSERHDPWWSYEVSSGRHASALMALLYQRVAEAAPQ